MSITDSLLRLIVVHNATFVERAAGDLAGLYEVTPCEFGLDALLECSASLSPAAVLLDQEFPGGLTPVERAKLASLPAPLLMVGTRDDVGAAATLLRLGALGLVSPEVSGEVLSEAIAAVRRGEIWLPRAVLSELVKDAFRPSDVRPLTRRELEILDLFSSGVTNQQIADQLCISRATVRWHLRSIYSKLGVTGRAAAITHPAARRPFRAIT